MNFKENMERATENLRKFLNANGFEEWRIEKEHPSLSGIHKRGFVIKTHTNLFNNYFVKCIVVTPENVILYGRNTPFNFTDWEILNEKTYSSKEELIHIIKSFIYSETVEKLWL